ncbi:hypothetical protein [Jidongwangia harbinensis]|uniref:hypothetical protein n=1 Tax=Jidongwangia harbinensis TaxID=2878561 RepID=UPI001CD93619|nr:hypothetical protein [Jidongwangia harbinensis]MCA2218848.1 hypothetical protein [Jidongwangia harbinensis]
MRRIIRIFVVAGVMAAGALSAASPAQADDYCPRGYHCLFILDLGSAQKNFFNSDPDFRNDYFPNSGSVDNNSEAVSNHSTNNAYRTQLYYGYNYSNPNFCVNPGGEVRNTFLYNDGIAGNYVGEANESGSLRLIAGSSSACLG